MIQDKIICLSNKKKVIDNVIKQYKTNINEYLKMYNDIYSYTRYLILIALNQSYSDQKTTYVYLNKDIVNTYKDALNVINKDNSFIIFNKLELFLNKLDTFLIDSTYIVDITNIDSIDIRNDMYLLNYFIPLIQNM